MDLQEVNVGGLQAGEGGVNCRDDCLAGESWLRAALASAFPIA